MATHTTPVPTLYQEIRLSHASPSPNTLLHIDARGTSAPSSTIIPFGAGRKRHFDEIGGLDEESYARKHLATEGSLFFRPKSRAPRSFLWRLLNQRQLLELRCVDLIDDRKPHAAASDCWLTFQISFPSTIVPKGVALADGGDKDALEVFVITGDDLYTVTLKRDLLTRENIPNDFDPSACVKRATISNFSFRRPYRLVAASNLDLLVSLQDGGLMRLQRYANESGSQWRQTHFSEGGWSGSFTKGLTRFRRQTIKYGSLELDTNAMAAIALSPDEKYVWTVGLDHVLKAWSTQTGKVSVQTDVLDDNTDLEQRKKQPQYVMDAEQGTLLKIADAKGAKGVNYFLVLHSPKDHQFKFYAVQTTLSDREDSLLELADAQPRVRPLIAPFAEMMGTTMWHLEDFCVRPGSEWQNNQLWVRARSGAICRVFTLRFDLLENGGPAQDLVDVWRRGWTIVENSSLSIETLRELPGFVALDATADSIATPTDKWLTFLLYPGRFSEACLEAALAIYRKGRNLPGKAAQGLNAQGPAFNERLRDAITAKIFLKHSANDQPDYDRYQLDLHEQWLTYFALLSQLHGRRHEYIGLACDVEQGLAWSICADFVAPIRQSDPLELMSNNVDLINAESGPDEDVDQAVLDRILPNIDEDTLKAQLLAVARQLRRLLSPGSQEKLHDVAVADALDQSVDKSALAGLQSAYEACNIGEEITNDDFDSLSDSASAFGGLGTLTDDHFLMILEACEESGTNGTDSGKNLCRYGREANIAIAQETLQRTQSLLLDLLALVVFMHGDLEEAELSSEFRPTEVYDAIILRLRHVELRVWLVGHVRHEPKKVGGKKDELIALTLYESIFIGDWEATQDKRQHDLTELLTMWSKQWTFGISLSDNWTNVTDLVMSDLLRAKDLDLAVDFNKFLTDTPFASYLKGRLHLARGEYELASLSFKESAEELSRVNQPATSLPHSGLLDYDELNHIGQGLGRYCKYISYLFEKLKAYSFTADFAYAALQHYQTPANLRRRIAEVDMRKAVTDSPLASRIQDTVEELDILRSGTDRDEILGRLFNTLNQTGRFEEAYHALAEIGDSALQKSNLQSLLNRCIKEGAISDLLSLPIRGDLVQLADAELLNLAKRSMGTSNKEISGPPYHQVLFAFRTRNNDFRGAAALLYMHMQYLRYTNPHAVEDPDDETLIQAYVLLINTLACCTEEAWLLADPIPNVHPAGTKRKLVRLEDIRREYVAELDRRSEVSMGRFPLIGDDNMDVF